MRFIMWIHWITLVISFAGFFFFAIISSLRAEDVKLFRLAVVAGLVAIYTLIAHEGMK
jgi:uncharacterized membrane protein YoaK (UPF0700 family)